jgi:photosystem II stability/assembly factor-like uncharacterized protein
MKLARHTSLFVVALIFACSTSKNQATPAAQNDSDASTSSNDDAGTDAGPATYEDAVNATSWQLLTAAPAVTGGAKQDDLWMLDDQNGFAVSGPASKIYGTQDGGNTWSTLTTLTGTYFRSIMFIDANHGFASNLGAIANSGITDTNVMYETKNAGTTWTPVTNITGTMPTGICNQFKIDDTHLVAVGRVGGPSFMMLSSDAGATWTSIDLNSQLSMLIDTRWTSPTDGIVVGSSTDSYCTILHTSDAGKTFTPVFKSATGQSTCWKISFPSDTVGYVSVQDEMFGSGTFAKTTDGGQTWTEMPLPSTAGAYPGIGIGFITENIGWISADDPKAATYKTTDGGQTWAKDPVLKSPINRFRFVDTNTAYAIGAAVYKLNVAWSAQ